MSNNDDCTSMAKIPNPFEALVTAIRVVVGVTLDAASHVYGKVFSSVGDHAPETTCRTALAAGGANLYEGADAMLDCKCIYLSSTYHCHLLTVFAFVTEDLAGTN
jgi:hypothetical protein